MLATVSLSIERYPREISVQYNMFSDEDNVTDALQKKEQTFVKQVGSDAAVPSPQQPTKSISRQSWSVAP